MAVIAWYVGWKVPLFGVNCVHADARQPAPSASTQPSPSHTVVGASNLQPATSSSAQMGTRPGGTHTTDCPCAPSAALQPVVG